MSAATVWPTDTPTAIKTYGTSLLALALADERMVCVGC